jgi:two-component system LytT family response regulator
MSAYDHFVYSAFDFYPFAYLRKSHLSTEFPKVLSRIFEKMKETDCRMNLMTTDGNRVLDVNAITYVESSRNYITVHSTCGESYTSRSTLTDFEQEIARFNFYRIHSGFLINLEHVEKLLDNGYVLVANKAIPIAQRRMQDFKKTYMTYIRRSLGT